MSKLPIDDPWAARFIQKRGRRNAVCGSPVDIKAVLGLSCSSHPKTPAESQFLRGVIGKHPLFLHLNPAQINSIVGAFKKVNYSSGDVVIMQGDLDAQLFFVLGQGECSVLVSAPEDLQTIKFTPLKQVGSKYPGDCFGELALMTNSPRTATVLVTSSSAIIFTLQHQDFQYFMICSGLHANSLNTFSSQSVPEAPELPLHFLKVPVSPPFHPNCIVPLAPAELARAPSSSQGAEVPPTRPRVSTAASASSALVNFRGLLLQPWPEALNDSNVNVLVPDIDPRTPQKVSASVLVRLNPLIQSTAENLIDLVHLNAQSVVEVLRNRFEWDLIYSAVGSMLIAVNPYRDIPYSVSAESARLYFAASPSQLDTMAPHVFAVAARAWFGLQNANFKPQSIIISGESGAGKTENTKFVLKALCQKRSDSLSQDIASKLLALNPITEAFGNACTLRNRNSSRFGKFIDISFDQNGDICGCFMHSYLLEKTRVVTQAAGERNYHIFYQVLSWAEADPSRYQELYLLPRTTYRYLGGQGDKQFADIKDSDDFIEVIDALHECLLSEVDILHLMRIVVLVMNLGNLSFSGRDGKEAADECEVADDAASEACCACMQVSREGLTQAFCTFETQMGLSKVESRIGRVKAGELRDAFSKMIMKLLFDDLVLKMNSAFAGKREDDRKIGVLDIFGFEIFDKNSLEQLCINYTNEKLQQLFCQYTFVHEQEVYTHEGIDWDHIHFEDNRVCIDLFEVVGKDAASFGLFKLLEEQCRFSQPTDEGFFLAFKKNWHPSEKEKKGAVSVTPAKLQRDCFTVAHYASDVSYNIHGLVEKNMDSFAPSMRKLIGNLRNPVLKSIFPLQMYQVEESPDEVSAAHVRKPTASSHSRVDASKTTVTSAFKVQVSGLMAAINKTVPQFVRCIKSNVEKRDGFFDWSVAERQIVTGGIVDAVSIVQQGFPYRRPCKSFAEHYSHLVPSLRKMDHSAALLSKRLTQVSDMAAASNFKRRSVGGDLSLSTTAGPAPSGRLPDVQRCKMILEHLKVSQDKFRVGNTLLFLRAGVIALLEDESARQRHRFATFITKNVTRFLVYRRYKRIRRALLLLQCARRCSVARVALRKRRAVVVRLLQTNIRRFLHRIGYVRMLNQIYHKAKCGGCFLNSTFSILQEVYLEFNLQRFQVESLSVLSPVCLRTLRRAYFCRFRNVWLGVSMACGPSIKRLCCAANFRKKYAAFLISLRCKSKHVLPKFLEHPIRLAFTQKRQFQGILEKKVNFLRWNARFFRLNFANGSIEYQTQEGVGPYYGELFFSKDSAVEKQGNSFRLSGTPNRKNLSKSVYVLRATSQVDADRWVENLKNLIDEVKSRKQL